MKLLELRLNGERFGFDRRPIELKIIVKANFILVHSARVILNIILNFKFPTLLLFLLFVILIKT